MGPERSGAVVRTESVGQLGNGEESGRAVKPRRTIRSWKLSRQTPASIGELAVRYNPILRGWFNYYGYFCKSAPLRVFDRFEAALVRWARRKYKKLARHPGRSFRWIWRVARWPRIS